MTLSDVQGRSRIVSLFNCDFPYSCAAVDKVSTDIARRAVPLQYLNSLFKIAADCISVLVRYSSLKIKIHIRDDYVARLY